MASSPWKFLFGLGRRRDTDETAAASSEPEIVQPSEAETPGPDAPLNVDEHPASDHAEPVSGSVADPSDVSLDVTPTEQRPKPQKVASSKDAAPRNEHSAAQTRKSKTPASKIKSKTAALKELPAAPEPAMADTTSVFPGVQDLDDEIRELRHRLAERLRLQNAQLKTMLERFERD